MRSAFHKRFGAAEQRIGRRRALQQLLSGGTFGALAALPAVTLAWWLRADSARLGLSALALAGLVGGLIFARRRRWSRQSTALYLDAKLESSEAIATALEVPSRPDDALRPPEASLLKRAAEALANPSMKSARPALWRRHHALAPIAIALTAWLCVLDLPAAPAQDVAPGSQTMVSDPVALHALIKELDALVEKYPSSDELRAARKRARELERELERGVEARRAQAELAAIRDLLQRESMRFGSGKQRRGLEAAVAKLKKHPKLSTASRALGDRDLTAFDREMQRLANELEGEDRKAAIEALEQAAEAARKNGASEVGDALEEQQGLMKERSERNEAMRKLAEALGEGLSDEARSALEALAEGGDPQAQQKLAEALADSLSQLSPDDLKRLANRLKDMARDMPPPGPNSADAGPQLPEQLNTPEGRKALADQLRRWANESPSSERAERQRGMGNAQRGLAKARERLLAPMAGGKPGGKPGSQGGKPGGKPGSQGGKPGGKPGSQGGDSPPGGGGERGPEGQPIAGGEVRSQARTPLNAGPLQPGTSLGHAPGAGGETANRRGSRALGKVAPTEVGSVDDRSEVPRPYREHVGRYFRP